MTGKVAFGRIITGLLALGAAAAVLLAGLIQLRAGRDVIGIYWVVVGLLFLRGLKGKLNTNSEE
jgi:hypothetical protein